VNERNKLSLIFERQWLHVLLLGLMLVGAWFAARSCPCVQRGQMCGISSWTWFWLAIEIAIVHQVFVWFCWRTELHFGLMSRVFGRMAFGLYAAGFAILFLGRFVAILILAFVTRDSIVFSTLAVKTLAVACLIPSVFLGYSVMRYFGILRAFGADHFDASYRDLPMERRGIFRLTPNAMYIFGFFALYIPGLWFASRPAIAAAVFSHLYIWVHYFTVELPDMRRIYGER